MLTEISTCSGHRILAWKSHYLDPRELGASVKLVEVKGMVEYHHVTMGYECIYL